MIRARTIREAMEDPAASPRLVRNTLGQFRAVNRLFASWGRTFRTFILPRMPDRSRPYELLDIGFGGGDVARDLWRRARARGVRLRVTAIDRDPRCLAFVRQFGRHEGIRFLAADHHELLRRGERFDFVISNHTMHHHEPEALGAFLGEAAVLATDTAVLSDIHRSRLAYFGFALLTAPFFHRSFVVRDGLASIRRSYREEELLGIVPPGWTVRSQFPFRLVLVNRRAP
jgi:2-polyprenyl-3-methyl-5-hydroxy-6-metoxy-1,4-benzoquinol methylase